MFPEFILGSVYSIMAEHCSFGHVISPQCNCFWFLSWLEYICLIWGFHSSCVGDSGVVVCDIVLLSVSWNFVGTWCLRNVGKHPSTQHSTSEYLIPVECTCLRRSYNILPAVLYWLHVIPNTPMWSHLDFKRKCGYSTAWPVNKWKLINETHWN